MRRPDFQNKLLCMLSDEDLALILPNLTMQVTLKLNEILIYPNSPAEFVLFPELGQVSVLALSPTEKIEVGMIGCEGLVGENAIAGMNQSSLKYLVQVPGEARCIRADLLMQAALQSPSLTLLLAKFFHFMSIQTASTALSHGAYSMNNRLARWLLMAHDRVAGDKLPFVHHFLSVMLGVRRAGVTNALHVLEGELAIRATRGLITVRDRGKLIELAGGSYGIAEDEYERIFGRSIRTDGAAIR